MPSKYPDLQTMFFGPKTSEFIDDHFVLVQTKPIFKVLATSKDFERIYQLLVDYDNEKNVYTKNECKQPWSGRIDRATVI